ncbi:MAG: isoleucine--tRNA ligase [Planctomycetes bacterium]|nr:isoleucine--tRNA ligase [Planctomycetota bacterium]
MPFDKVETTVDFPAAERSILQLWDEIQAFEKLRAKNQGKPKWSFLDGPITANNPMGVHHAWGRTYKDAYQRYFAMTGHELRYQNGFDCQGLWVEVEVEKELALESKRDIENLVPGDKFKSIDMFVSLCKARVNKFARRQTEQSIRLGQWMDWDRTDEDWAKPPGERKSYFTMAEENNYTIWGFLKKCHERKLIYKSYDAMPWCGRCGTGISQQEMNEGYQMVAHRSVFVKFPIRRAGGVSPPCDAPESSPPESSPPPSSSPGADAPGSAVESLLIWTTTPWTLSSNVGAAVNPTLTYLKVKHKDEIYYVAKGAFTAHRLEEQFKRKEWVEGVPKLKTLEQIFKEKGGYEIVGELPGKDMVGWQYDGPFDELPAQHHLSGYPIEIAAVVERLQWGPANSARDVHRVVAWDVVGETEGTGIVHIAPGCGKEDFVLGKEQGLVPIAPLDDSGVFLDGFGYLSGESANDPATTDWILDNLTKKNRLLAVEKYPHSYPHCWRCKTELLFRLVDEWFIDMKWRDEIMRVVEDVTFLPESINGKARELDWLKNMGDWMISKKRFWGLALPIWVDEQTGDFEVIGSYDELKTRAVEGWDQFAAGGVAHSPHRPWIDLIKIKNPKTGNLMSRISDVGNPWLDAGIVPYSTVKYNTDRAYWQQWFPADFITEAFPGQFRNWFYAILTMSTMLEQKAPMKVLLGHGMVRDDQGDEMHKAKGNSIPFEGAANDGYEIKGKDGKLHKHPPMGSDLMRWMYCRNNPAANINFGPTIAEEVRSKFIMKLWNTYAFFCNYARLDGFDPNQPGAPATGSAGAPSLALRAGMTDIDRWILSDLQLLIQEAHKAFQSFNVMAFCLKAEEFVDDKLSNWYVRRNRRRFWKADKGADKQAAYQTLYTVLTTLVKLCAPVIPFMTESMYQNLKPQDERSDSWGSSVHLCDYPIADETLIDHELSAEMDALLRIVSLGGSARNAVKIKVRQPLAEIKIQPANDNERKAVERFADQIREELNIKAVTLHDGKTPLLSFEVKLNPKAAGPRFGPKLGAVTAALARRSDVVGLAQDGKPIELALAEGTVAIETSDLWITPTVEKGFGGIADHGTQILLDGRLTPELELEGLAREIVRHVQTARKEAGLEMDDRIVLMLRTDDVKLHDAIRKHRDYIASETLVVNWATDPLGGLAHRVEVKIDGMKLIIELRKKP